MNFSKIKRVKSVIEDFSNNEKGLSLKKRNENFKLFRRYDVSDKILKKIVDIDLILSEKREPKLLKIREFEKIKNYISAKASFAVERYKIEEPSLEDVKKNSVLKERFDFLREYTSWSNFYDRNQDYGMDDIFSKYSRINDEFINEVVSYYLIEYGDRNGGVVNSFKFSDEFRMNLEFPLSYLQTPVKGDNLDSLVSHVRNMNEDISSLSGYFEYGSKKVELCEISVKGIIKDYLDEDFKKLRESDSNLKF